MHHYTVRHHPLSNILQVHHHTPIYVTAIGHTFATSTSPYSTSFLISLHQIFSTSASPYCTLCPLFWSPCYKYITIFYFAHTSSTTTSPLRSLRHFHGPHFFYLYIVIMYFIPLPWDTLLHVHHHTGLYATALGHISSTYLSPYCALRRCSGSHFS